MRAYFCSVAGAVIMFAVADASQAADYGRRYDRPSADAAELAALAPPASRSTANQTYGDAQIARSRFQRRTHLRGPTEIVADAPLGIVPCEPRVAQAAGYACRIDPRPGYGKFYAFTPAYVTAPQVPRNVPNVDQSLLPPATSFFLSADNYLFGSNN